MRLVEVRLQNFRCYEEETSIPIDDLTALVGKNDAGKSAILQALAIFFGDEKMESGDGSVNGDAGNVRLTCLFDDLPESLVIDAEHDTTLESEYLLNEEGLLEIVQLWNASLKTPKCRHVLVRAYHPSAEGYDNLLQLKISELRSRIKELGINTSETDMRTSSSIRRRIWEACPELRLSPQEVPIDDAYIESGKKVWDQLKSYLPTYALFRSDRNSTDQDDDAQDPMKAAVKEAIKAQEETLEEITERIRREVLHVAEETVEKLQNIHPELAHKLVPQLDQKSWDSLFKLSLEGDDDIPVNKRGSGVRRLILLGFFQSKVESKRAEANSPSVVYAVEEPETCLHPNWQRMLLDALMELAGEAGYQVILSTHTPMLGSLMPLPSLRYIEMEDGGARRIHAGDEETYELVAQSLGVLPDNRVRAFIAVEGPTDMAFLKTISATVCGHQTEVPNLAELEEEGQIIFIPMGGSNLQLWTNRLRRLRRPEFHLYDRDVPPKTNEQQAAIDEINKQPNSVGHLTGKREIENYIHPRAIEATLQVQVEYGPEDDVPEIVARAVHEASGSPNEWDELLPEKQRKKKSRAKTRLSKEAASAMTVDMLEEQDSDGDVVGWLREIQHLLEG